MHQYYFHECDQSHGIQDDFILLNQRRDFRGYFLVWWMRKFTISFDHLQAKKYFPSVASLSAERKRHLTEPTFSIHPFSSFRSFWELLMVINYTHLFLISNFGVAFGLIPHNNHQIFPFIFYFDSLCIIILILDLVINFFTAFPIQYAKNIELRPGKIAKRYICSYFFLDLYCINPFHLIIYFNGLDAPKYLYFLSLFRLFRFGTYLSYINRLLKRIGIPHVGSLYCKFFITFLVILLSVTYFRWSISFLYEDRNDETGYITMKHRGVSMTEESLSLQLFLNFYYCSSFFTFHATESGENVITGTWLNAVTKTIFCAFGSLISVLVFISLANIRLLNFKSQVHRHNLIQEAYVYSRLSSLPHYLHERLINYYNFTYDGCYWNQHKEIISLTGQVKQEILNYICRSILEDVHIMRRIPARVKFMFLERMELVICLNGESITEKGSFGRGLYLIRHGMVAFYIFEKEICHISTGGYFGDFDLFEHDHKHKEMISVVAIDNCELFLLIKKDFVEVMMKFPEIYKYIKEYSSENISIDKYIENLLNQKKAHQINFTK